MIWNSESKNLDAEYQIKTYSSIVIHSGKIEIAKVIYI